MIGPAISLLFVTVTAVVLVVDLEQPQRFYYILVRPNWRSWMVWGAYFLTAHGALTTFWLIAGWIGFPRVIDLLVVPSVVVSMLATSYTGFLFAQGLARDLWQGPHAAINLVAQAIAEGSAAMLIAARFTGGAGAAERPLAWALGIAMAVHLMFITAENLLAPSPTRHHELAVEAITRGVYARIFWVGAMACGLLAMAAIAGGAPAGVPWLLPAGSALALLSSFAWEYVWVEAGQSVPLS